MRIKRLYEYNDDEFEEEDDTTHENEDGVCFFCGSNNIDYEDLDFGVPITNQNYYCLDCSSTGWFEYEVALKENHGEEQGINDNNDY